MVAVVVPPDVVEGRTMVVVPADDVEGEVVVEVGVAVADADPSPDRVAVFMLVVEVGKAEEDSPDVVGTGNADDVEKSLASLVVAVLTTVLEMLASVAGARAPLFPSGEGSASS